MCQTDFTGAEAIASTDQCDACPRVMGAMASKCNAQGAAIETKELHTKINIELRHFLLNLLFLRHHVPHQQLVL